MELTLFVITRSYDEIDVNVYTLSLILWEYMQLFLGKFKYLAAFV